jgi:hypothetical protein
LQEEVDEAELLVEQEEVDVDPTDDDDVPADDASEKSNKTKLKEKTHLLMGGRASNDRKWKDAQVAFAKILEVSFFWFY